MITVEPTAVNSNGTQYATGDRLGSPRVVTNGSGSVVSRHDYLPFGEELGAGTGGRTTGMGFSASDNNRKKFTGYERDTETGLDFAEARYYSSSQGRFTRPDPFSGSAPIADPQTFNRYAYCRNNPVNATDPTGMTPTGVGWTSYNHRATEVHATEQQANDWVAEDEARYQELVQAAFSGLLDLTIMLTESGTGKGNTAVGGADGKVGSDSSSVSPQYTEASGEPTPAAKLYGPFVIKLPSADNDERALRKWMAQHPNGVGDGDCAQLPQILADVFGNSQGMSLGHAGGGRWRAGPQASDNEDAVRGTVVISGVRQWGNSGLVYYPNYRDLGNHAAIILAHLPGGGLRLLEQIHGTLNIRSVPAGEGGSYFSNARGYYVLMVGPAVLGIPNKPSYYDQR